jgi:hypothetical protein
MGGLQHDGAVAELLDETILSLDRLETLAYDFNVW